MRRSRRRLQRVFGIEKARDRSVRADLKVHDTNRVGQWVRVVRCQCGRRWFEVEAFDTASCPRCGLLVFLDIQQNDE